MGSGGSTAPQYCFSSTAAAVLPHAGIRSRGRAPQYYAVPLLLLPPRCASVLGMQYLHHHHGVASPRYWFILRSSDAQKASYYMDRGALHVGSPPGAASSAGAAAVLHLAGIRSRVGIPLYTVEPLLLLPPAVRCALSLCGEDIPWEGWRYYHIHRSHPTATMVLLARPTTYTNILTPCYPHLLVLCACRLQHCMQMHYQVMHSTVLAV